MKTNMKRVEELWNRVEHIGDVANFDDDLMTALGSVFGEMEKVIRQQQEALNHLATLNEHLQNYPEFTKGRIGQSVALTAINIIKQQAEQIERKDKKLKIFNNHFKAMHDLGEKWSRSVEHEAMAEDVIETNTAYLMEFAMLDMEESE